MNNKSDIKAFERNFKILETLSCQTAVHRKKIEFALSQLRKVVQSIIEQYELIGKSSGKLICEINSEFENIQKLIRQNILQTWTLTTLDSPVYFVLEQLIIIFSKIREIIIKYAPGMAIEDHLDLSNPEQWEQYNILDLRAIEGSFSQFLLRNSNDNILFSKIEKKLSSIQESICKEAKPLVSIPTSPIPSAYQNWKVNLKDFQVTKEIGHGVTARVFLAKDNRPNINAENSTVAIKRFELTKFNGSRFQSFQREVAVLATCQHPALLRLVGMTDTIPFCIITEWMPNGSLFHDLHKNRKLDQTYKTIAAYDIARGMQYLHSRQIAHRDLKSLNVLIDSDLHVKLCDFGFSRHTDDTSPMSSNIGTPHWMAPEILKSDGTYTAKVDVYAYGVVLWEIATGKTPYYGMDSKKIVSCVLSNDIRPEIPSDLSPALKELIRNCWDTNPDVRPTFDQILKQFKKKKIFFPGADIEAVSIYIDHSATVCEVLTENIEILMKKVEEGKTSIEEAINTLSVTKIPVQFVDDCWSMFEKKKIFHSPTDTQMSSKALLLFASTPRYFDAARALRLMPRGSVPLEVISRFVEDLPTGSTDLDTNIAIAACRNGAADLCAVYLSNPQLGAFALEVACQRPVDPQLREAIIDKCAASIMAKDRGLQCAALRCLLTIDEVRRLPRDFVFSSLDSSDITLQSLAILAIISFSMNNIQIPESTILGLVKKMPDERVATALIAMTQTNIEYADFILGNKIFGDNHITPIMLKMLLAAVKHEPLLPKIHNLVQKIDFSELLVDYKPAVEHLKKKLSTE